MTRRPAHILGILGAILALLPLRAQALGLGEILAQSSLGEPLRLTLGIVAAPGEQARAECFRLAQTTHSTDGLPQLRAVQFQVQGSGADARLTLSTARAVNDPVLKVAIRVGCDEDSLVREFTLLLDPPLRVEAATTEKEVSAPPPPGPQSAPSPGTSANLALVTEDVPQPPRTRGMTSPSARPARPGEVRPPPSAMRGTPAAPAPSQTASRRDRLQLMGAVAGAGWVTAPRLLLSTTLSERNADAAALSEDALALLRAKQARLKAAPEDQDLGISVEAELVVLDKRLKELQATLDSAQARLKAADAREAAAAAAQAAKKPASVVDYSDWFVLIALALALAALGLTLWQRRRRQGEPVLDWPAEAPPAEPAPLPESAPPLPPPPPETETVEAESGEPRAKAKAGLAYYHVGDTSHHLSVSELAQVTEEARVFLTLGHPDKAILALREHIDLHAETAPAPWLMLLDLYRRTDKRGEYERTAAEFRHRYNAFIPPWEDPGAGQEGPGIEAHPHLVKQICDLWRSPTCKVFLDELLYDDRGGNRIGFNLTAYQEIMLLRSLLEHIPGEPATLSATVRETAAPPLQPVSNLEFELDQDLLPAPAYRSTLENDHPGILERLTLNWGTPHAIHFLESLVFADHTAQASFSEAALSELMLLHDVAVDIAGLGSNDQWEQDPGMGRKSARQ